MAGDPFTRAIFRWLNGVVSDSQLPPAAFKLAYILSQFINRTSRDAWPSQRTLRDALGVKDERSVRRLTDALEEGGYVITRRRKNMSMVYRLAQDRTELSYQEEQSMTEEVSGPDIPDRSTDQDRSFFAAGPDKIVSQDRTELSAKPLKEPLSEPKRERRALTTLPEDWKLSDEDNDFAVGEGVTDIEGMAGAFSDYYRANGKEKVDWSAAWRGWVRRERKFNPTGADQILAKLRNSETPAAVATDVAWDQVISLFAQTGIWTRHVDIFGSAPLSPNCRAPRHLLAKHGIIKEAEASQPPSKPDVDQDTCRQFSRLVLPARMRLDPRGSSS